MSAGDDPVNTNIKNNKNNEIVRRVAVDVLRVLWKCITMIVFKFQLTLTTGTARVAVPNNIAIGLFRGHLFRRVISSSSSPDMTYAVDSCALKAY